MRKAVWIFAAILSLTLAACSGGGAGGGGGADGGSSDASDVYPTSLGVASPLDVSSSVSQQSANAGFLSRVLAFINILKPATPAYAADSSGFSMADQLSTLNSIISGTSIGSCTFDPQLFFTTETFTNCYGPTVDYTGHADAGAEPADGQLPSGDLGLWNATETDGSGTACSAMTLNNKMKKVSANAFGSLQVAADLVCVSNANGIALPSNSSSDLTAAMNDMVASMVMPPGVTAIAFNSAALSHSDASGINEYSYAVDVDLTYDDGGVPKTMNVILDMTHRALSATTYTGRISFSYNGNDPIGNCAATGSSDITRAGSILYSMDSGGQLSLDVRNADFCGTGGDPFADGLVDPTDKLSETNLTGWGNNFSRFIANMVPSTMDGSYSYAWQAGPQDGNTRVFNITLENNSGVRSGDSYFGFGDDIAATDGTVKGFICNWAGPGNTHLPMQAFIQAQQIEEDTATKIFTPVASYIMYDPVNNCDSATGTFSYKRFDGSGNLAMITDDTVVLDLQAFATYSSGFTAPTAPANF
ncbi:MAG: hypothetical protein HZA16_16015 [Nitrospirae bacterium]|nr:hypothetical protein [Nitrospirota bacterium]